MTNEEAITRALLNLQRDNRRSQAVIALEDLHMLVRIALEHAEISIGRAAEILGMPVRDIYALHASWRDR